jgi:Mn-dependent DtxR family transcriptional regulator
MSVDENTQTIRDLNLLEHIEKDPDITQASLAMKLGVAVGTVNWHLKRLIKKGAREVLSVAQKNGHKKVAIVGKGDIADVCRLTCLEQGFSVVDIPEHGQVPVLEIDGKKIILTDT